MKFHKESLVFTIGLIVVGILLIVGFSMDKNNKNTISESIDEESDTYELKLIENKDILGYWYDEDNFYGLNIQNEKFFIDSIGEHLEDTYKLENNGIVGENYSLFISSYEDDTLTVFNTNTNATYILKKVDETTYKNNSEKANEMLLIEETPNEELVEETIKEEFVEGQTNEASQEIVEDQAVDDNLEAQGEESTIEE